MMKKRFFQTMLCAFFLSSTLFLSVSYADWQADRENGGWKYQMDDGSFACGRWIDWNGGRYYMDGDGCMVSNQTMTIDGTCYGFYGDGRVMHESDITDVQLGYVNLYSSSDTMRTASSKWARYTIKFPGTTNFIDYRGLSGRKPICEFLATVPSSGNHPLSVWSSYFHMEGGLENYESAVTRGLEKENYELLSSAAVVLGNEETYQKLSFVYDSDGVYGRPIYRDCYIRKIGDFCHILTFEYESFGADLAEKIVSSVTFPQ